MTTNTNLLKALGDQVSLNEVLQKELNKYKNLCEGKDRQIKVYKNSLIEANNKVTAFEVNLTIKPVLTGDMIRLKKFMEAYTDIKDL